MHDALTLVGHVEVGERVFLCVLVERLDLQPRYRIGDAAGAIGGRHIVVSDHQIRRCAPRLPVGQLQPLESLRAGHFVDQVAVNVENGGAVVGGMHHVGLPEFVVEGLGHGETGQIARQIKENSPKLCHTNP